MDVCLSACKRITLDDQYFLWIFTLEVDKKFGFSTLVQLDVSSKQGKKYQYSEQMGINYNFS